LTKGNYDNEYVGQQKLPVLDCQKNQLNSCRMKERTCRVNIVDDADTEELLSFDEANKKGYKPCSYCNKYMDIRKNFSPALWYEYKDIKKISWAETIQETEKWKRRTTGRRFKSMFHPNSTLTVDELDSILEIWYEKDNFIPDVIVIDYIDILKHEVRAGGNERDAINNSWKGLRKLSQKWDNLIVGATQADADSYDKFLMGKSNFSEDHRKYAHVTAMFGINQTEDDKERKIMRWNSLVKREGDSSIKYVTVLQALAIGRPHVGSF
jgi:hypothetical protein